MPSKDNRILVRTYVKKNFVDKGMCADVAIHDTGTGNPHAHIMLTMRPFNLDRTWGAKSKKEYILDEYGEKIRLKSGEFKTRKICANDWNEQTKAEEWRDDWANAVNFFLDRAGVDEQVDHRSFVRQGIERVPTIHLGVAASQMEKRGIKTELGDRNREISLISLQLRQLMEHICKLKDWLKEYLKNAARPIADVVRSTSKEKESIKDRLARAKIKADEYNANRAANGIQKPKLHGDRDLGI